MNGLDEHTNQLLKLNKAVYGLVQASKCFYRRITTFLSKKLGFEISRVDPCLMRKVCKENNKILFIGLYVDDILLLGDNNMLENTTKNIKKEFELTVKDTLDEYVGSQIEFRKNYLFIHQRRLIEKIEKEFKEYISNMKSKKTPMVSNQKITLPEENDTNILQLNDLRKYQSGVGSLLYLVRNSRPDIGNAVRELSKSMDRSNDENMNHLYNVIKYVVDTKSMGLKFSKIEDPDQSMWCLKCYVDSDWDGDHV